MINMAFTTEQYLAMQTRLASNRKKLPPTETAKSLLDACTKESDLHNAIIQHCKSQGWICFHGSMAHRSRRTIGEPDATVIASGGRVFFIELKTKSGKLSPEQLATKVWAETLGTTIHTIRSYKEYLEIVK